MAVKPNRESYYTFGVRDLYPILKLTPLNGSNILLGAYFDSLSLI